MYTFSEFMLNKHEFPRILPMPWSVCFQGLESVYAQINKQANKHIFTCFHIYDWEESWRKKEKKKGEEIESKKLRGKKDLNIADSSIILNR